MGPPCYTLAQRSLQCLSARYAEHSDGLKKYACNLLKVAAVSLLAWNLVGFTLHFVFFFGRLLNARANVALDREGVLYVVAKLPFCAPLTDAYNETAKEVMLTKAMAIVSDLPPDKWPWYTCPWCLVAIAWPESAWDALCDVDFTVWILAVMAAIVAFFAMFSWSVYSLAKAYRDWRGVAPPDVPVGPDDSVVPVGPDDSVVPVAIPVVAGGPKRGRGASPSRRAASPAVVSGFKPRCKVCREGQDGVHTLCRNATTANGKVLHITSKGWPDAPAGTA